MKNFIGWMLAAVLLLAGMAGLRAQVPVWDGSVAESFAGGTGTPEDPYLIETPAQLAKLAKDVNARNAYDSLHFRLESDMDLGGGNGLRWEPIGTRYVNAFNGHFDGNYKHITGLYVNDTNKKTEAFGLFGIIGSAYPWLSQASVRRLTVSGTVEARSHVAGVVAAMQHYTLMEDCVSLLDISAQNGLAVGGLAGRCDGMIRRCIFGGSLRNGNLMGGIAGQLGGTVEEVINFGLIDNRVGSASYTGGIVGVCTGNIRHAFNSGSVFTYNEAGGIVGRLIKPTDTTGRLDDCLNVGYVSGRGEVGAVLGIGKKASGKVYYDVQTASGLLAGDTYYDGSYSQQVLTRMLTSGNASACEFSEPEKWVFKAGSYPAVKALAEHPNDLMAQLVALATLPVVTPDEEAWCALKSDFTVGTKITTAAGEKNVEWKTDMPGLVSFSDNKGTLRRPGTDTMVSFYAEIAGTPYRKQVWFQHYKIYEDLKVPAYKAEDGAKIYEIAEFAHLAWVNAVVNGVIYMESGEYVGALPKSPSFAGAILDIAADIDMAGYNWIPMAGCGFSGRYFGGYIRGNGHAIKNLTIDREGEDNIGLIGFMGGNGSGVENLCLSGGLVKGYKDNTGALAGLAYVSNLRSCTNVSCKVQGAWVSGGLAGTTEGTVIHSCANMAEVTSSGYCAGGITGQLNSDRTQFGQLEQSYNQGPISSAGGYVGGLTGSVGTYSTVTDCFNAGPLSGDKDLIGGVAGTMFTATTMTNCYNVGKITKPAEGNRVGDVVGENGGKVLENNYYNKDINGIGGVAGADGEGVKALVTADMRHNPDMVSRLGSQIWMMDEKGVNDGYPIFRWMKDMVDNEDQTVRAVAGGLALRVYPNPASETVYVEQAGLCELAVYRLMGQRVLHRNGNDMRSLDVSGLPAGLYVLRATDDAGRVYTCKLNIVKH